MREKLAGVVDVCSTTSRTHRVRRNLGPLTGKAGRRKKRHLERRRN